MKNLLRRVRWLLWRVMRRSDNSKKWSESLVLLMGIIAAAMMLARFPGLDVRLRGLPLEWNCGSGLPLNWSDYLSWSGSINWPASKDLAIWFGAFVTLIGIAVTTFFAVRKERREADRSAHELEKIQLENQKLRGEVEKQVASARRRVKRPS